MSEASEASEARLAAAIRNRDIETLKSLLTKEPDLVYRKDSSSTESWANLCFETKNHNGGQDCDCVELLVNHGSDINAINEGGYGFGHSFTPVMHAVNLGCLRCVKFLIEKGADLSIETQVGETALIHAVKKEEFTSAEILIQRSSRELINHRSKQGTTALMWAVRRTHNTIIVRQLIEAGADVNITDNENDTALVCAVCSPSNAASILIQHSTPALINHRGNFGRTVLMLAATRRDEQAPSICKQLIDAGADVNITDNKNNTALFYAVKWPGDAANVEILIQHSTPASINHRDDFGRTALMWSAECRNKQAPSMCKMLIDAGADVNLTDNKKKTALLYAVKLLENAASVKVLIQHSTPALINHRDDLGRTALMWAAESRNEQAPSMCKKFIDAGADVNLTDYANGTALIYAIKWHGNTGNVEILIQHSAPASINQRDSLGKTPLMWAATSSGEQAPSLCKQLIDAGADVNMTDNDKNTALIYAVTWRGNAARVKVLIQHSTPALINQSDKFGRTALMWAAGSLDKQAPSFCKQLIDAGADVNMTDNDKNTALIFAVKSPGNAANGEVLIEHSTPALINHRGDLGKNALMWAATSCDEQAPSMCKQLIEAGAYLNILDLKGNTVLIQAIKVYSKNVIVELIIQHCTSALINQKCEKGRTALMWAAAIDRNFSICQQLIEAGADVNLRDNKGKTALMYAFQTKNEKAVPLLLQKEALVNNISTNGKTPLYYAFSLEQRSLFGQLLEKGADLTISLRHKVFIHKAILNNDVAILRSLVINGFPPIDCSLTNITYIIMLLRDTNILQYSASPLALALWKNRPDIARYLITNKFFTPLDFNPNLPLITELREHLANDKSEQCQQILEFHLQTVHTLSTLCLVTISSCLTQNYFQKGYATNTEWRFKPTFKERVKSLGLPPQLQRALLHQKPFSRICCRQWENISLEEEGHFPNCDECSLCADNVEEYANVSDESESDLSDNFESDGCDHFESDSTDTDTSGVSNFFKFGCRK